MKRKIYFISSAPIEYTINNHDLFDSFDLVSKGVLTAPLKKDAIDFIQKKGLKLDPRLINAIYTAEKGQCLETAKLIRKIYKLENIPIINNRNFNGVTFSMGQLIEKNKFLSLPYEEAIIEARRQFIRRLFENKLTETLQSVMLRMKQSIAMLDKSPGNLLCISHGFYLKLLEIYCFTPGKFKDIKYLEAEFEPDKRPFKPMEGFEIDI